MCWCWLTSWEKSASRYNCVPDRRVFTRETAFQLLRCWQWLTAGRWGRHHPAPTGSHTGRPCRDNNNINHPMLKPSHTHTISFSILSYSYHPLILIPSHTQYSYHLIPSHTHTMRPCWCLISTKIILRSFSSLHTYNWVFIFWKKVAKEMEL